MGYSPWGHKELDTTEPSTATVGWRQLVNNSHLKNIVNLAKWLLLIKLLMPFKFPFSNDSRMNELISVWSSVKNLTCFL